MLVAGAANALRALPTLGLLIAAVVLLSPHFGSDAAFVVPALAVLVVLAVPPILTNAYAGCGRCPNPPATPPTASGCAAGRCCSASSCRARCR
ncbi:hypothetical protein ACFQXA_02975 [Nocardiopsis composta]